jgi:WD40 repeat protein
MSFSYDGRYFGLPSNLGYATVWELSTLREAGTFGGFLMSASGVGFSPDNKRLAVGSDGKEAVRIWDLETRQELLTLEGQGSVFFSIEFSPDGNLLGAMNLRGTLHLWRAPSWQEIKEAEAAPERERALEAQDQGRIKKWRVLAPIPYEGTNGAKALGEEQVPDEAGLRPRAGEAVKLGGRELAWREVEADDSLLDFGKLSSGHQTDWSLAYAVCYIESGTAQTDLSIKVSGDDQYKVYLNGKEVYRWDGPYDPDEEMVTGVELKAGLNRLVFKVVNGWGAWTGSIRFTDAAGQPVKGIRVTLTPPR